MSNLIKLLEAVAKLIYAIAMLINSIKKKCPFIITPHNF